MSLWKNPGGFLHIRFTSADPSAAITAIARAGVILYQTKLSDFLTVQADIRRQDCRRLRSLLAKRGENLIICGRRGLYWKIRTLLCRPVLTVGLAFLFMLAVYCNTHVLFIQVQGCRNIPPRLILEQAEACGITMGTSRRALRSEQMKNALLEAVPQLEWAGINTFGCVATISVAERVPPGDNADASSFAGVEASRDGLIRSVTVLQGNALCVPGQAVRKGDLLISGYRDLGLCIRVTPAEGEIFADTSRKIHAVLPMEQSVRGEISRVKKKFSLIIGKKRINFYKDSGISEPGCVKMSCVKELTLPGGFVLPVALEEERVYLCQLTQDLMQPEKAEEALHAFAASWIQEQMIAGRILTGKYKTIPLNQSMVLSGSYACREMIGRARNWETTNHYGENFGTNSQCRTD